MLTANTASNSFFPPRAQPIDLELLDPYTCLITNVPIKLSQSILETHELVPSFKHQGYATKLKMLNSLKRCFEELGFMLLELPNSAFKMFRVVNAPGLSSQRRVDFNDVMRNRKLVKGNWSTRKENIRGGQPFGHKNSLFHIGRWILNGHQRQTIDFFLNRGRRIIIGDGWSMGKTVTSLACSFFSRSKRVLVIAPKVLLAHWTWHINQLCTKQLEDTCLQILDLERQTGTSDTKSCFEKAEIKFKSEQCLVANFVKYTLCSYEHLRQVYERLSINSFNLVILDEPILSENCHLDGGAISGKIIKKLKAIESVLITKLMSIPETRCWLSILNTKMQESEVYARYGRPGEQLRNSFEYQNSVTKYYFHCGKDSIVKVGPVIKNVLINNIEEEDGRLQAVEGYIRLIRSLHSQRRHYFLVFHDQILLNHFRLEYEFDLSLNMGTLPQILSHFEANPPQNPSLNVSILCDLIPASENSYEESLYRLQRFSNIEYIEYCAIRRNEKGYKVQRPELANNEIYLPQIQTRKFVERIMLEGQYVESDDGAVKKDPERYMDSGDSESVDQNKMIDQSEEKGQMMNAENHQQAIVEILDDSKNSVKSFCKAVEICLDSDEEPPKPIVPSFHDAIEMEIEEERKRALDKIQELVMLQSIAHNNQRINNAIRRGRNSSSRSRKKKEYGERAIETRMSSKNAKKIVQEEKIIQKNPPMAETPLKQLIEIGSDSELSQTRPIAPIRSTKMPKCKSGQVLSVKLVPKMSYIEFPGNLPFQN